MMSTVERALLAVSILIFIAALFGVVAMLLSSMRERAQELVIIRALGARPITNYWLLVSEALLIMFIGMVFAIVTLMATILVFNAFYSASLGMSFSLQIFTMQNLTALVSMVLCVVLICFLPAFNAYRVSKT